LVGALVLFLIFLVLGLGLFSAALVGAGVMFAAAAVQGFIGIIVFFAAWVFLFPLMVVLAIIIGVFVAVVSPADERQTPREKKFKIPNKRLWKHRPNLPPTDPEERLKWANRLPPYDN
jgi:hypothetical protein